MKNHNFKSAAVKAVFDQHSPRLRRKLLFLRELVFQIAAETAEVGEVDEVLKWQNPSYLTLSPKSGTTIRLSGLSSNNDLYAISVHCQSTLIAEFKELYPDQIYDGNRSLIFDVNQALPEGVARHFIYLALTYHYRKKNGIGL